jgi:hypothetical protein
MGQQGGQIPAGSCEWRKQVAKVRIGHEIAAEIRIYTFVCGAARCPCNKQALKHSRLFNP